MRFWFLTCLLLAAAASAAPKAAPKKPVVVVDGSAAMVKLVSKSLGAKYAVVPAGKRGGEVAFINVTAEGKELKFAVLNAADGADLGVVSVPGTAKKPPKTLPKPKLTALLTALGKARATPPPPKPEEKKPEEKKPEESPKPEEAAPVEKAPPPEEKPVAKTPPPEAKKPEEKQPAEPVAEEKPAEEAAPSKPSAHYAFRASVQGGIFNRNLYAIGSLTQQPRNSPHPASGAISVDLSTFPGAGFTSNFLAHLGAFVSADFGANLRSRVGTPTLFTVTHSSTRIRFGVMGRLPIGDDFSLVAHAGYARHTLFTYVPRGYTLDTPDMLYNGFRGGLLMRWHIAGPLELELGAAGQYVSSLGTLRADFPKAKAFALDAQLALSIELVEHLRLRFSGEWQRYFITLNGDVNSPYQTRAAGDQYVWVSGGLQWSM